MFGFIKPTLEKDEEMKGDSLYESLFNRYCGILKSPEYRWAVEDWKPLGFLVVFIGIVALVQTFVILVFGFASLEMLSSSGLCFWAAVAEVVLYSTLAFLGVIYYFYLQDYRSRTSCRRAIFRSAASEALEKYPSRKDLESILLLAREAEERLDGGPYEKYRMNVVMGLIVSFPAAGLTELCCGYFQAELDQTRNGGGGWLVVVIAFVILTGLFGYLMYDFRDFLILEKVSFADGVMGCALRTAYPGTNDIDVPLGGVEYSAIVEKHNVSFSEFVDRFEAENFQMDVGARKKPNKFGSCEGNEIRVARMNQMIFLSKILVLAMVCLGVLALLNLKIAEIVCFVLVVVLMVICCVKSCRLSKTAEGSPNELATRNQRCYIVMGLHQRHLGTGNSGMQSAALEILMCRVKWEEGHYRGRVENSIGFAENLVVSILSGFLCGLYAAMTGCAFYNTYKVAFIVSYLALVGMMVFLSVHFCGMESDMEQLFYIQYERLIKGIYDCKRCILLKHEQEVECGLDTAT